nr:MAG TPA_asm: hypothetical protein [Caudoviricetes sp.]
MLPGLYITTQTPLFSSPAKQTGPSGPFFCPQVRQRIL